MEDSSWCWGNGDGSLDRRTVKRPKTVVISPPSFTPMSHFGRGTANAERSLENSPEQSVETLETPLLEQYRSALSDLNGRAFQRTGIVGRNLTQSRENRAPGSQSASCQSLVNPKPSPQYPALAGAQFAASNNQEQGVKPLSSLPPLSVVSSDWRESQLNLSPSKIECRADAGEDVDGFLSSQEDEDDDSELLFDWRSPAGASLKHAKRTEVSNLGSRVASDRPPTQGLATQCSNTEVAQDVINGLGSVSPSQKQSSPHWQDVDWDPECIGLDSESQEGALSQLLEMVNEDAHRQACVTETEPIGPRTETETLSSSHEGMATTNKPDLLLGRKAHISSDEERSRFIVAASQAALADSAEQSGEDESEGEDGEALECPVCGIDLQQMDAPRRDAHTNRCLDGSEEQEDPCTDSAKAGPSSNASTMDVHRFGLDYAPLVAWLDRLQLGRYAEAFVREEVDFDGLHCLKEEDLESMGVVALGPKRKLLAAIKTLRRRAEGESVEAPSGQQDATPDDTPVRKPVSTANRRITDFFPAPSGGVPASAVASKGLITSFFTTPDGKRLPPPTPAVAPSAGRGRGAFVPKKGNPPGRRGGAWKQISGDPPEWHLVPGTDFRVDAFRFQSPHCRHWFLSHFHADHYQGLTRNFRHGVILCTPITARLVNMKLGVPLDKLRTLPLGERARVENCHVTLLEANHCPGAAMMLFEPDGAQPTLHTGDFRYCPAMANYPALQSVKIGTLILDTTYCDPQYDFPAQDAVIQFVIDAIQAETFNPKTLFLIGAYTIGKERVFLEVARELNTKVYVGAARRKVLACLDLPPEDMARLTANESESNVHVVPLWSLANFKRLTTIAKHYQGRYNTFVSFSPTGWSFGRGKKRTTGTRRQQGTIVRYEVPYSEHSSFSELRAFVRVVRPGYILPHVNNDGGPKAEAMLKELLKAREPDA